MSLLDRRLLHTFVVVAEERHFGRAAKRMHLSQPPVSQRVRQLEEHLGVQLFVRSTRQVTLTQAGRELYDRAKKLLHDAAAAEAAVKRLGEGSQGELSLGFTRTVASQILPRLLEHYHDHKPDVTLHLHEDWSARLMEMVSHEKLDVALLRRPTAGTLPNIQFTLVQREPLWVALHKSHPLARHRKVSPKALTGEAMVGYSASSAQYFHEVLHDLMGHYGIAPEIRHQSAVPTVLALVNAGMGLALVPESIVGLRADRTVMRPLGDPDNVAHVELYAATRADETSTLISSLIATLLRLN